jgi:glycosyltransferase involved in cell wall biosynthesis
MRQHERDSRPPVSVAGPQIAVVIPALNEEKSIGRVLQAIPKQFAKLVVVVDNGSSDHTVTLALANGAQVLWEPHKGYGAACLAGIAALPQEVEIIVFLDADYSDYPEEMEKLVTPIVRNQTDFVLGSRMVYPAASAALTPQQRWGNWLATRLIRLLFGYRYSDLGPFRAIRKRALESLRMSDRGYGWTVEMQIKAIRAGLRILEVPVQYRQRLGQSKISGTLKGTIHAGSKILYTVFRSAAVEWRKA